MNEIETSSQGYILWNRSTGFTVGAKEADTPVPVASLTKMMTAILVLEDRNLDEEVTITPEMLEGLEEFSVIGLQVGQVATVEDLLYATMLPSAGDAAQALAISTAGSIEEFVARMNSAAHDLGMEKTHFSNPVGFDAGTRNGEIPFEEAFDTTGLIGPEFDTGAANYSTPRDIAKMLNRILQNARFKEIFETDEKELPSLGMTVRKTFTHSNYIKGGKTGFTNAAGRCLASIAEIESQEYILVTVGADGEGHIADAERIYRTVEKEYEPVKLVSAGDALVRIGVEGSPTKALEFFAASDHVIALPKDFKAADLAYSYEGYKGRTTVGRWTYPEEPFGYWKVSYQGQNLVSEALAVYESCENTMNCIERPSFYSYGGMLIGAIVTLILAGLTVREFLKARKRRLIHEKWAPKAGSSESKVQKIAPWAGLVMTLVSLVVMGFVFWDCSRPAQEIEVLAPEVRAVEALEVTEEPVFEEPKDEEPSAEEGAGSLASQGLGNCTTGLGNLMLINPNFPVGTDFIAARREQLISLSQTYGIQEYHAAGNGDNLMMPEAAAKLNEMLAAYSAENPGHEMGTYSCFRSRGTQCGRLCAATGESDHHTGLTCDLIDLQYGSVLNTDTYPGHLEWQWLKENSYKYGFIDRFPEAWAGGSMAEPLNVDENGSTGLFETWHYRYVGVAPATEIATG